MKTLILDGSPAGNCLGEKISETVIDSLKEHHHSMSHVVLHQHDIKGCIGCLNCFFKTPGRCRFNDLVSELPQTFIESKLVIFLTPMTFGGYSSVLARAFDRIAIQLESHLLERNNGVLRRRRRYPQEYPVPVVIGFKQAPYPGQQSVFNQLVEQNAKLHFHAPWYRTLFFTEKSDKNKLESDLNAILTKIVSMP